MEEWVTLAEAGKIEEAVVAYTRISVDTNFANLVKVFAEFIETEGTSSIELGGNVVAWSGMSEKFAEVLLKLIEEKKLFPWPCSYWEYLWEGKVLDLPLVKGYKESYKKRHWLPTALRVKPCPSE